MMKFSHAHVGVMFFSQNFRGVEVFPLTHVSDISINKEALRMSCYLSVTGNDRCVLLSKLTLSKSCHSKSYCFTPGMIAVSPHTYKMGHFSYIFNTIILLTFLALNILKIWCVHVLQVFDPLLCVCTIFNGYIGF